jgi:L-threonylcarbamoyladenylate synthase
VSAPGARPVPTRVAVARVARVLRAGGVVAYPTEGVYGLGCLPDDAGAVDRLLALKGRDAGRGLIVIGARFEQVERYLAPLTAEQHARLDATWPGPVTWVALAHERTPRGVTGGRDTVAVRVTAHPLAAALCEAAGAALVSTSANRHSRPPARTALAVRRIFGAGVDDVLTGACGPLAGPTEIRDLLSGRVLRAGAPACADATGAHS